MAAFNFYAHTDSLVFKAALTLTGFANTAGTRNLMHDVLAAKGIETEAQWENVTQGELARWALEAKLAYLNDLV